MERKSEESEKRERRKKTGRRNIRMEAMCFETIILPSGKFHITESTTP